MVYAGFDRAARPTLAQMQALRDKTNLVWCGYYLKAPSQSGKTWRGSRADLVAQGWGLAPIFVGQQTAQSGPGSHIVTAAQGSIDGANAAVDMREEGFPLGSWVYLDLENGPPFGVMQRAYVAAWVDSVEANGYRAGVYGSYLIASEVKSLRPSIRMWVFHVPTVRQHPVQGVSFPVPDPQTSGFPGATIWQREMSAQLAAFDGLLVDLDVASVRDPSAPGEAADVKVPVKPPPPPDIPAPQPTPPPAQRDGWVTRVLNAIFGPPRGA